MTKTAILAAASAAALISSGLTRDPPGTTEDRRAHPPQGPQARFAAFQPSSYAAETRSVDLVLSIGAPVTRYGFVEELEISASAIDLARVTRGLVPLLNAHNKWEVNAVLGTISNARFETDGGVAALVATATFADTTAGREAEGMVSRGELRGVSIGYDPKKWELVSIDPDTEVRTWRATSWELLEASLVPVPADPAAGVRSAAPSPGLSKTPGTHATQETEDMIRSRMMGGVAAAALASPAYAPDDGAGGAAPATPPAERAADPAPAQQPAPEATNAVRAAPASAPSPAGGVTRFSAVDALSFSADATAFGLGTRASELVAQNERGEISVETARATLLREAGELQRAATGGAPQSPAAGGAGRAGVPADSPEATRSAVVDALVARTLRSEPTEQARQFMGMRLLELAVARTAGLNPRERDPLTILRAAHTTSDFPLILEAAGNKILLARYNAAQPTYQAIARRRDLTDFKATKLLRIGDFPTLKAYAEDGEIQNGTINEGRESVTLGSFGRILRLSRQAIVNDDLGAFDDVFGSIGGMIRRFENATAYAVKALNSGNGPKLSDNVNLFNSAHGNLAGSGGAISVATLGTARAAMMKQTDLDGNVLNLMPKVLLVGADQLTTAQQVTASIQPVVLGEVNPFAGQLQVVAEGAVAGNGWELYADPAEAPVWSYGYLSDSPGPRVISEEPFNVDGMAWRVTLDFYFGGVDYRGAYRNAGA
jgi:HK97 family phage prohead protease